MVKVGCYTDIVPRVPEYNTFGNHLYMYFFILDRSSNNVIETNVLLRERNFGVLEDKPIADYVNAANSAGFKKVYKFVPEGGESASEVRQRVKVFMKVRKNI